MRKLVVMFCALLSLFAVTAASARSDKLSGPGFFITLGVSQSVFALRSADAFVDGQDVFFVLQYTAQRDWTAAFFDPPARKNVNISAPAGIQSGDNTLVFSVPAEKVAKAPGFTLLIGPTAARQFVYFGVKGGVAGLARKEAPEDIRNSAIMISTLSCAQ